jgi:hypothetical protein
VEGALSVNLLFAFVGREGPTSRRLCEKRETAASIYKRYAAAFIRTLGSTSLP